MFGFGLILQVVFNLAHSLRKGSCMLSLEVTGKFCLVIVFN